MKRWLTCLAHLMLWLVAASAWAQTPTAQCSVRILTVSTAEAGPHGARPDPSQWRSVTLPDDWNRRQPGFGGSVWYRIDWQRECPGTLREPVALVLQSVVMAGEAFINDEPLWRDAQLIEPLSRSWNLPRHWRLPEAWIHDGVNTLWVRVVGVAGQSLGLGPVFVGDSLAMQQRYDEIWWRHRTLFMINIIVSGVMAALFFCIWVVRREQTAYGWYVLMYLFWVLFIANVLVTTPWPWQSTLTVARFNTMALLLSIACFCVFTWRFGGQHLPRIERALWWITGILLATQVVVPDAYVGHAQLVGVMVAAAIFYLNGLQFPFHALRTRQREHALLAGCLLILLAASLHDLLLLLAVLRGSYPISPYTSIVVTLCLSGILGLRHAHNVRRIEQFNQELADGITDARAELATTLAREHALTLGNTRLQERLQIAHDLHDGVGGSLVHMMALVEQSEAPLQRQQVLSMLKLIRDDLRQTIDSSASVGVEVPATPLEWIAPLRYRFTELFDELGIAIDWQCPAQWRTPPSALQCLALIRLLEESLTNVVKHSRARRVRVCLELPDANRLMLSIDDDGVGFDVAAVRQAGMSVGMRSMHLRIARVGGTLTVSSQPGHTMLKAELALKPTQPPQTDGEDTPKALQASL